MAGFSEDVKRSQAAAFEAVRELLDAVQRERPRHPPKQMASFVESPNAALTALGLLGRAVRWAARETGRTAESVLQALEAWDPDA